MQEVSYHDLLQHLRSLDSASSIIIGIDGVAGSGKTTLSLNLQKDLGNSQIIHMDDLYEGWSDPLSAALSERVVKQILEPITSNESATYDRFNWAKKLFDEQIKIVPSKYVILEGVGAGQKYFRNYLTNLIWVSCDPKTGFERVLARDGQHLRNQMIIFLKDQNKHFEIEKTDLASDYNYSGVP